MRKGYMYALEGVIAGLLVVFYVGSMVQTPEPTSWDKTVLTRRAGDLMNIYSRTGMLEDAILENDPSRLSTLTSVVGGGVDYRLEVDKIPKSEVEVGIVRSGERYRITDAPVDIEPSNYDGITSEEDYAKRGTFGEKEFILVDSVEDGNRRLNTVYFDFDGDGDYGESGVAPHDLQEGPYIVGHIFEGCFQESCSEPSTFQIGYVGDALGVYRMDDVEGLVRNRKATSNGFGIRMSYTGVGMSEPLETTGDTLNIHGYDLSFDRQGELISPEFSEELYGEGERIGIFGNTYRIESTSPIRLRFDERLNQDVLVFKDEGFEFFENNRPVVEEFLLRDGTVVELANLSRVEREEFSSSFHSGLGLRKISSGINRYGPGYNVIRDSEPSSPSGFIRSFFYDNPLRIGVERFSSSGPSSKDAEIEVGERKYTVRYDEDYSSEGRIGFSEDDGSSFVWKERGEEVLLGHNDYYVEEIYPLKIVPREEYKFENMYTGKIKGEEAVLEAPRWEYNFSGLDRSFKFEEAAFGGGPGAESITSSDYRSIPESTCSGMNEYRIGDASMVSDTYPFILTDINCDGEVEYTNFDFNPDRTENYFNQTASDFERYSREGIYQEGEIVEIEGLEYRIGYNSTHLQLEGEGQNTVGTGYWNQDVYRGHGSFFYTGNVTLSDSTSNLLETVFIRASVRKHEFTSGGPVGSPNVGTVFTEDISGTNYLPFTIETVWWFR